jgi:hypothetical protein
MCEPFYGCNNVKILAYCLFYFIPTLVLMYCYGSVFHSKHMQAMGRAVKSANNLSYGPIRKCRGIISIKFAKGQRPRHLLFSLLGGGTRHISGGNQGSQSTTNSSMTIPTPHQTTTNSTARLLFMSSFANPEKHLKILRVKV